MYFSFNYRKFRDILLISSRQYQTKSFCVHKYTQAIDVPLYLFATGSGEPGDTERFLPCPV